MIEGFQQGLPPSSSQATNLIPTEPVAKHAFCRAERTFSSGAVLIDGNSVQRVQEQGIQIALAGPEAFDVGSWTLLPAAEVSLRVFADQHLHNRLGVRLTGFAEPGEAKWPNCQTTMNLDIGGPNLWKFFCGRTPARMILGLEAERIHIATRGSRVVQGAIGPEMRRVELRLIETTSNLP